MALAISNAYSIAGSVGSWQLGVPTMRKKGASGAAGACAVFASAGVSGSRVGTEAVTLRRNAMALR